MTKTYTVANLSRGLRQAHTCDGVKPVNVIIIHPLGWFSRKVHSGIINLFDERIVYSPDKDYVCSKRGTTEIL